MRSTDISKDFPASAYRGHREAEHYKWAVRLGCLLLLSIYVISGLEAAPLPILVILIHVIAARVTIMVHEYIHCVKAELADWWVRILPVMIGPLSGFREIAFLHHTHHAHPVDSDDPDLAITLTHPLFAYAAVFFYFEFFWLNYVRARGIDNWQMVVELLARVGLFTLALWLLPWQSVLALSLSTRLAFTTSYFLLSWYLHREGEGVGTFRKSLPPALELGIWLLGGQTAVDTLAFHDIHHDHPRIDVRNLRAAAEHLPYDSAQALRFRRGEAVPSTPS